MAVAHVQATMASEQTGLSVFYIDNHLRPYTGQQVIRKGWRMQDKRARPGISDYYVHDEDGRPVLRIDVPSHDSLTVWLTPTGELLQEAVGPEHRILLAFDRAGAFPEELAGLRDKAIQFVTYERRPYPTLPTKAFTGKFTFVGEEVRFHEKRLKNLGAGRGRVRRLAFRTGDKDQVNLLAVSSLPAEELYMIMRGRWEQENAFRHGVQRWGINQLDGRQTEPYPPTTIIPDPARRRLDEALQIERTREGRARRELARASDAKRAKWQSELDESLELQREFEALRPALPTHAPLCETELAGELVRHKGEYKTLVDAVRIAGANAESELACLLAAHLPRPAEAKQVLLNVFKAPGSVRVARESITVRIEPAGTKAELHAISHLLAACTDWKLTLPGDVHARPIRFELQC
jgi:hypothetical protein